VSALPTWNHASPYREPRQPRFRPYLTGPLELAVPPAGLVVTLAEAKAHCRIDTDMLADDGLVLGQLRMAQEYCERAIDGERQLLSATYNLPVEWLGWHQDHLELPRPPLQQVVSVTYLDGGGNLLTLDPSQYLVRTPRRQPGYIERAPFVWWPSVQLDRHYPITVQFTAGHGPSTTVALAVSAGTQTVTPGAMQGILPPTGTYPGTRLVVDVGTAQEIVNVTATTATTFTATFAQNHPAGVSVIGAVPDTVRQAVLMLAAHWYRNREATAAGQVPKEMDLAVRGLLGCNGWGSYA